MANRNPDRDRPRQPQSEWDWDYYSQYEYTPYSPYLRNDQYGRDYYGPEYAHETPYNDRDYRGQATANRGPYSGYGPRGYARPDDGIREDVNDRLTWDDRIDATDIEVTVTGGTVVLDGSVDSRGDKRTAEDIADSVPGVWDVHNHLRVRNRGYYRGKQAGANRDQIRRDMEVVDSHGKPVGTVKEVHPNDFLMERTGTPGFYVPFNACEVSGEQVHLNIAADQIHNQNWEKPETTGSHGQP
jgi:hypothetical protein